ncbi:MAG: PEGA domain-containing protein [Candidatus Gottesmanbacteria bacterium]|nr:PEGA domain-containing protein [Candidatus Gottesmanbacteria bacterium]
MKRKIGFFTGVLAIILLLLGVAKYFGGMKPKEGALTIQSTQPASVFLDNKHIGRTPVQKYAVVPGDYTIRIVPESTVASLASWQGSVKIASDILTHVNINPAESEFATAVETMWLEKISSKVSELDVVTNPDSATISLDGQTKGITPLSLPSVAAGPHVLALASPGFVSQSIKIQTTAGYKLSAVVKLALSGSPQEASPSPTPASGSPTPTGKTTPTPTGKLTPTKAVTSADPVKPFVTIKDTPTGFLRVRMEPKTSATESAQIKPGEKYSLLDSQSDAKGTTWYQIKYDGTNKGWISGQYATKTE